MKKIKNDKIQKSYRIILQFPTVEKQNLELTAQACGLRPSQYIKMKILENLRSTDNGI